MPAEALSLENATYDPAILSQYRDESLPLLGRKAVEAEIQILARLNGEAFAAQVISDFLEAVAASPYVYFVPVEGSSRANLDGDSDVPVVLAKAAPIASDPGFHDLVSQKVAESDSDEIWLRRWKLCAKISAMAVAVAQHPDQLRAACFLGR